MIQQKGLPNTTPPKKNKKQRVIPKSITEVVGATPSDPTNLFRLDGFLNAHPVVINPSSLLGGSPWFSGKSDHFRRGTPPELNKELLINMGVGQNRLPMYVEPRTKKTAVQFLVVSF